MRVSIILCTTIPCGTPTDAYNNIYEDFFNNLIKSVLFKISTGTFVIKK
jgi:hypothetical protein